jgi:DNA topoisomerase-1
MFEALESAEEAGLKYVTDKDPGIRRHRRGKGFTYIDESTGRPCQDKKTLARIKSLVIPPAWKDVWICKQANGHLQCTGYDVKGRKQYRYHETWSLKRNETKFTRLMELGNALPKLRARLEADLKLPGLPRNKVVAAVIKLMLITQCRVGNAAYAEENESYGLTTLLNNHAEVKGSTVKLSFRGKSGVDHDLSFVDPQLSRIIGRCQELPGEELFCYLNDENEAVDINSSHVNDYLYSVTGDHFTAKDLRTWGGTCKALELLLKLDKEDLRKETQWKKRHLEIIKKTAEELKNTVSVCRKYYVHPLIFQADRAGVLELLWRDIRPSKNLNREEKLLLRLLEETKDLQQKQKAA